MKICFLVGSMKISGGTYVIVQHASYLKNSGHDVTLAIQEPFTQQTLEWHDEAPKLRCVPTSVAMQERFDLVIATWWKTALELGAYQADRFSYFVQSIESRFYPSAESPLKALVDATYRLPVHYVTEATWIKTHLETNYGHQATLVRNGVRKDVYHAAGNAIEARPADSPRVLIEGHFGVKFKNTALAIRLAKKAGAKDIWLLTGSTVRWVPGVSRVFSQVPMVKTADIYRSCDILIKLSTVEGMFGPPLEMFHCGGTAVVFNVTGHDEYILDGKNALVASIGDLGTVVDQVATLLNDKETLQNLKKGALETAKAWPSWNDASLQFAQWVDQVMLQPVTDQTAVAGIVKTAFETYEKEEKSRLDKNPAITRRHKLSAMTAKFPKSFISKVKALEAAGELIFGGNKVH